MPSGSTAGSLSVGDALGVRDAPVAGVVVAVAVLVFAGCPVLAGLVGLTAGTSVVAVLGALGVVGTPAPKTGAGDGLTGGVPAVSWRAGCRVREPSAWVGVAPEALPCDGAAIVAVTVSFTPCM